MLDDFLLMKSKWGGDMHDSFRERNLVPEYEAFFYFRCHGQRDERSNSSAIRREDKSGGEWVLR